MVAHKILIMSDGISDEDIYCFEDGARLTKDETLEFLMIPHKEPYESALAYYSDIVEAFAKYNTEFDIGEAEIYMTKMFDMFMCDSNSDYEIYLEAFEEMWELAQMC